MGAAALACGDKPKYMLTKSESRHPWADRINASNNIVAEHERKSTSALEPKDPLPVAFGALGIDRIDGRGRNPHEHLAAPQFGQRDFTHLQARRRSRFRTDQFTTHVALQWAHLK